MNNIFGSKALRFYENYLYSLKALNVLNDLKNLNDKKWFKWLNVIYVFKDLNILSASNGLKASIISKDSKDYIALNDFRVLNV